MKSPGDKGKIVKQKQQVQDRQSSGRKSDSDTAEDVNIVKMSSMNPHKQQLTLKTKNGSNDDTSPTHETVHYDSNLIGYIKETSPKKSAKHLVESERSMKRGIDAVP